jgi:hypothetical protein
MTSDSAIQEMNRQLAKKINDEARNNPQSPYAGKFVGISDGQVVVVADDLNELGRRLRHGKYVPARTFGIEASRDHDQVEEIWRLR